VRCGPRCALQIPADYVINALLAVMTKEGQKGPGSLTVYQVATGVANPLLLSQVASATSDHFRERPSCCRRGGAIRLSPMKLFKNPFFFFFDIWFKYQLPLQVSRGPPDEPPCGARTLALSGSARWWCRAVQGPSEALRTPNPQGRQAGASDEVWFDMFGQLWTAVESCGVVCACLRCCAPLSWLP